MYFGECTACVAELIGAVGLCVTRKHCWLNPYMSYRLHDHYWSSVVTKWMPQMGLGQLFVFQSINCQQNRAVSECLDNLSSLRRRLFP